LDSAGVWNEISSPVEKQVVDDRGFGFALSLTVSWTPVRIPFPEPVRAGVFHLGSDGGRSLCY
jgi:hypothetical protein